MVDMNESGLWGLDFRCYEQLKVVNNMKDSESRA